MRERDALVEIRQLGCGDYLVSAAFALERKAPRDVADSLLSGKLFAQLAAIADSYEYGALLIEGDDGAGDRKLRSPLLGALYHSLSLRPNLTVIYSPSTTSSATRPCSAVCATRNATCSTICPSATGRP